MTQNKQKTECRVFVYFMLEFRDDIITIHVFSFYTDKATNPLNKETDWDNVKGFCDQLSNEPEG